jgi:Cu-processing system ATP-binding protein
MLGLAHPTAGYVRLLGENPAAGQFAARRRLGYLPESVSFNPALTAREVLTFYARLKEQPISQALELLDRVGLGTASGRRIGTYSKGMRQRLGLAQAMLGEPRVLLLDEPTSGLDPALRLDFYDLIEARRASGATVVLSSHALAELGDRAARIIIMNRGAMVANGSIDQLRRVAQLPARIRCKVAGDNADAVAKRVSATANCRRVNSHTIEIDAASEHKIALLQLVADSPVEDVDVVPPSLDELYAHFLRGEAAP